MKVLVAFVLALGLHLLLGWPWTVLAGVVAGFWAGPRGWLFGGAGVGLGWLALVLFDYAVAARAVQVMTDTLGGLLGNLSGLVIVGMTLLIGVVLGALGGAVGTLLKGLVAPAPARD